MLYIYIVLASVLTAWGQTGGNVDVASMLQSFVKRYAQELSALNNSLVVEQRLADDKVLFRLGTLNDLRHLPDNANLDITHGDGYYEMTWSRDTIPFLCIAFPAQNTLITGLSQRQLVEQLPLEIQQQSKGFMLPSVPTKLEKISDEVWATPWKSYYLNALNDALYYEKLGDSYVPLFTDRHRDFSACNLLHGLIDRDYRLFIDLSLFDFSSKRFIVSLSQWVNLCRTHGMYVYCGIEEEREDGLKMLLIAEQRELKYNHMLSIIIPDRFVLDSTVVLKARLNAYIPTHNVANLYKQYAAKKEHPKYKVKTSRK